MEMKLLVLFVVMNVVNVVIQTIKSIATIKCGKWGASVINALAYGLYTYIVVLTMCDLPLLAKCLIVAGANFVGVYVVKLIEEKLRKDKLWKVEATVPFYETEALHRELKDHCVDHNYVENVGNWTIFNIYCVNQEESVKAKKILSLHDAKYFVSESKNL